MKPHKYADLIKAWADGDKVQLRKPGGDWEDIACPCWVEDLEYRLAPTNERYIRLYATKSGEIDFVVRRAINDNIIPSEFDEWFGDWVLVHYNNETRRYVGPVKDETT